MAEPDHPVVLVTGAARRIGAEIARCLHAAGYDLALHYRTRHPELDELLAELEAARAGSVLAVPAELAELDGIQRLVETVVDRFGRLDALVNNASMFKPTPLADLTPRQWDELFAANARAPLFLAQAAAPHLARRHGCIVNLTDIHAEFPMPQHVVYCMSKAALRMATMALAQELGPDVRVNAVAPGNILWPDGGADPARREELRRHTALGRQGAPSDIAGAVLWLIRDAGYVSGQTLRVDGGRMPEA